MRELKEGDVVAGLVIKGRLGKGGMGDVYLAHDEALAVDRALKIISLSGPGFTGSAAEASEYRQRFLREARTLARLRHPNIITVHATGEVDGNAFLVMTHFPSKDARHWLHDDAPTLERIRRMALQAARALAHAHESGVLHRDLKLSNLLVGPNDDAMLIDFGLAKSRDDSDLTRTGRSMGTFSYLAPEYVRASMTGRPKHTVATDLWAFGCILYALTCCRPAFKEREQLHLLRLIERAQFPPVKTIRPKVADDWAKLIHELMEPDVARRLPSAAELARRLESVSLVAGDERAPAPAPAEVALPTTPAAVAPSNQAPASVAAAAAVAIDVAIEDDDDASDVVVVDEADAAADIFDTPKNEVPAPASATPLDDPTPGTNIPQPSFQQPADAAATSQRESAKRKLLFPIAAALSVLVVGGALILWTGSAGARAHAAVSVDTTEYERRERAERELADLAVERESRSRATAVKREASTPLPPVPLFAEPALVPAPHVDATNAVDKRARTRKPSAPVVVAVEAHDPWRARYGSRTTFNTSSAPPSPPAGAAAATTAAVAGIKIPVRVNDAIASAPLGPVIATVQTTTRVGVLELPRGAELHGRIVGAEGPRILLEFTFAIVNGRNVAVKGIALGSDGRAGVPGVKNAGGFSDVGAGAVGGAAAGLVDAAVGLVDNDVAKRALSGGGGAAAAKAERLNNAEQLVIADRGARFFVYVETAG